MFGIEVKRRHLGGRADEDEPLAPAHARADPFAERLHLVEHLVEQLLVAGILLHLTQGHGGRAHTDAQDGLLRAQGGAAIGVDRLFRALPLIRFDERRGQASRQGRQRRELEEGMVAEPV